MRRPSIALVLLLVAPLASAQVYKWTDAQGTTHYSETPPATGTKYSQVTVSGADVPAASSSSGSSTSSAPASSSSSSQSSDSSQSVADTPENRAKYCASLKSNITTLQGSAPVVSQSGGQQQLLNADQRKQQLDASQSQYQQYCGDQQQQ
jgi:cytoskeletal protein RodZ